MQSSERTEPEVIEFAGHGRLICGDSRIELASIASESIDHIVTDPPYGMSFQSAWRTEKTERFDVIANDESPFIWFLLDAARVLKPGGCLLCFCRWDTAEAFRLAIGWAGLKLSSQLIWDRMIHGMGDLKGEAAPMRDTVWFATKGKFQFSGKRPKSVLRHQRLGGEELRHPNEKPVKLMRELIASYTKPKDVILDPFAGSGTTLLAAMQEDRSFIGIELDSNYFELARGRIEHAIRPGMFSEVV